MKVLVILLLFLAACATATESTVAVASAPKKPKPISAATPTPKPVTIDCREVTYHQSLEAKHRIRVYQHDLQYEKSGRNDWIVGGKSARINDLTQELDRLNSVYNCHPDQ